MPLPLGDVLLLEQEAGGVLGNEEAAGAVADLGLGGGVVGAVGAVASFPSGHSVTSNNYMMVLWRI